jgi:hypothetical protein
MQQTVAEWRSKKMTRMPVFWAARRAEGAESNKKEWMKVIGRLPRPIRRVRERRRMRRRL